jgi:hypothetical protein
MDINLQSGGTGVRNDLMLDAVFASPDQFFGNADAFGGIGSSMSGRISARAACIGVDLSPGMIALAVMAVGTGYALYSAHNDRNRSPGRQ